jgi:NTP pyrophosphatase (non-canonical NTP hydrolase)
MVVGLLKKNYRIIPLNRDEAFSEAFITLLTCIDSFDQSYGNKFSSYYYTAFFNNNKIAKYTIMRKDIKPNPYALEDHIEYHEKSDNFDWETEQDIMDLKHVLDTNPIKLSDQELEALKRWYGIAPYEVKLIRRKGRDQQSIRSISTSMRINAWFLSILVENAMRKLIVYFDGGKNNMPARMLEDVESFHKKFRFPVNQTTDESLKNRLKHIKEEVSELEEALEENPKDIDHIGCEVADIAFLAIGTCVELGIDFQKCWNAVVEANMDKRLNQTSKRAVKPAGWKSPTERLKEENE